MILFFLFIRIFFNVLHTFLFSSSDLTKGRIQNRAAVSAATAPGRLSAEAVSVRCPPTATDTRRRTGGAAIGDWRKASQKGPYRPDSARQDEDD